MNTDIAETHYISDPDTMWVIASPARLEILKAACALGVCSAGDIAELTGRSRTSLYPHVEQLLNAGLLIESGTRPSGKRQEQLYRPIARLIYTCHDRDNPKVIAYHIAHGKAVCRQLARVLEQAIARPDAVTRGPHRDTMCGSHTLWANDDTLAEINTLFRRVTEICAASEPGEGKRLIQVGFAMAPESRGSSSDKDDD